MAVMPATSTTHATPDERVVMHDVSWDGFEAYLSSAETRGHG